jgi:hypothetical protein
MPVKPVVAIALAVLLGPSCPALPSDPFPSQTVEAEFRWHARDMYASLRMPSCKAPPGFDRKARLEDEYQAIGSFERQARLTPAGSQLAIARADAAFEQARGEGCWMEYSDLVWAEKHVALTKEKVRGALGRLHAIAPSLHENAPGDGADSKVAPEFRYLVRQVVASAMPPCRLTSAADNEQVMGPAQAEIARFRQGLEGTAFAGRFDAAQADVAYALSVTSWECAAPGRTDPNKASEDAVANVRRQLAAIGGLIKVRGT